MHSFWGFIILETNGEYQYINEIKLYPEKIMLWKSLHTMQVSITEDTKAILHFTGFWIDGKDKSDNFWKSMK